MPQEDLDNESHLSIKHLCVGVKTKPAKGAHPPLFIQEQCASLLPSFRYIPTANYMGPPEKLPAGLYD